MTNDQLNFWGEVSGRIQQAWDLHPSPCRQCPVLVLSPLLPCACPPPRFHSSLVSRQIPSDPTSPDTASTAAYHTFHPNGTQRLPLVSPCVSLRAWIRGSSPFQNHHCRSRSPRTIFLIMSRLHPQVHPSRRRTPSRIPYSRSCSLSSLNCPIQTWPPSISGFRL